MNKLLTPDKLKDLIKFTETIISGKNPITDELLEKDNSLNNPEFIRYFYFIEKILKDYKINNKKLITEINKKDYILDHGILLTNFINFFKSDYMTLDKKNIEPDLIYELLYKCDCLYIDQQAKRFQTKKGYNLGITVNSNSITLSSNAQEVVLKLLCNEEIPYDEKDYFTLDEDLL